jgi:hypothetical protein
MLAVHDRFKTSGIGWPMTYVSYGRSLCGGSAVFVEGGGFGVIGSRVSVLTLLARASISGSTLGEAISKSWGM